MRASNPKSYKKNFLTKVVFRMDYPPIVDLQSGNKSKFSENIASKYQYITSKPIRNINVKLSETESGIEEQMAGVLWEHRIKENGKRTVSLAPEFLGLEYGNEEYKHLTEFESDISFLFSEFNKIYNVKEFSRIGLRYINEITFNEGNPFKWDRLINSNLITSVMAGKTEDMKLSRSMHQLVSIYKEDINILFQYGFFNPEFPNPIARKQFILDIDGQAKGPISNTDVLSKVCELNDAAIVIFENSIEDELRKIMEVKDE